VPTRPPSRLAPTSSAGLARDRQLHAPRFNTACSSFPICSFSASYRTCLWCSLRCRGLILRQPPPGILPQPDLHRRPAACIRYIPFGETFQVVADATLMWRISFARGAGTEVSGKCSDECCLFTAIHSIKEISATAAKVNSKVLFRTTANICCRRLFGGLKPGRIGPPPSIFNTGSVLWHLPHFATPGLPDEIRLVAPHLGHFTRLSDSISTGSKRSTAFLLQVPMCRLELIPRSRQTFRTPLKEVMPVFPEQPHCFRFSIIIPSCRIFLRLEIPYVSPQLSDPLLSAQQRLRVF
jgi:hypothetical protein